MSKLDDLKPMAELARIIGMNRQRLRALCIKTGIAIQWGGNSKCPRLRAKLSDVERVILSNRPAMKATPQKHHRKPVVSNVHHLVHC